MRPRSVSAVVLLLSWCLRDQFYAFVGSCSASLRSRGALDAKFRKRTAGVNYRRYISTNSRVILGTPLAPKFDISGFLFCGLFSALFSDVFMSMLVRFWLRILNMFLPWFGKRGNSEICTACRREAFFYGFWSSEITENLMKIKAGNRIVSLIDVGVIFKGF